MTENVDRMSGSVHYAVNPGDYLEPMVGTSGVAALPPRTVMEVFRDVVRKCNLL